MKSASYELAESHTIVTMHGRPGVRRRILDLINIPHMEMLHRALHRLIRHAKPFSTNCCTAPYLCCHAQSAGLRSMARPHALPFSGEAGRWRAAPDGVGKAGM